jgi:AraC-like DNA-binding protein
VCGSGCAPTRSLPGRATRAARMPEVVLHQGRRAPWARAVSAVWRTVRAFPIGLFKELALATDMDVRLLTELASKCGYKSRELARALGITPRHLQRRFAAQIGRAPQEWLNEQRLLAAGQMLRQARAVKEVAYRLGFRSASQLSRDFRNHFGVQPSTLLVEGRGEQGRGADGSDALL